MKGDGRNGSKCCLHWHLLPLSSEALQDSHWAGLEVLDVFVNSILSTEISSSTNVYTYAVACNYRFLLFLTQAATCRTPKLSVLLFCKVAPHQMNYGMSSSKQLLRWPLDIETCLENIRHELHPGHMPWLGSMIRSKNRTLEALMSMRTKLGLASGVKVLKAPVADPGLMRNLSSYL